MAKSGGETGGGGSGQRKVAANQTTCLKSGSQKVAVSSPPLFHPMVGSLPLFGARGGAAGSAGRASGSAGRAGRAGSPGTGPGARSNQTGPGWPQHRVSRPGPGWAPAPSRTGARTYRAPARGPWDAPRVARGGRGRPPGAPKRPLGDLRRAECIFLQSTCIRIPRVSGRTPSKSRTTWDLGSARPTFAQLAPKPRHVVRDFLRVRQVRGRMGCIRVPKSCAHGAPERCPRPRPRAVTAASGAPRGRPRPHGERQRPPHLTQTGARRRRRPRRRDRPGAGPRARSTPRAGRCAAPARPSARRRAP